LIDLCEQDAPPVDGVRRLHRITGLLPDSVPAGALRDRQFATEFFEHLQEPVDAESLLARLDEQHLPAEPFVLRLRSIIGDLDNKAITGHAIQQGIAWFGAEEEGSAT
jgi:hypothetical protein